MRAIFGLIASLSILFSSAAKAQEGPHPEWDAATIYAILDGNEFCAGGAIHIDLWSGEYVRLPRTQNPDCQKRDRDTRRGIEHGALSDAQLSSLRKGYRELANASLQKDVCELIISNGGRELVAIVAPTWVSVTPDDEGCWQDEEISLKKVLLQIFSPQQEAAPASNLAGRRIVAD